MPKGLHIITTTVPQGLAECAAHAAACCHSIKRSGQLLALANQIVRASRGTTEASHCKVLRSWNCNLDEVVPFPEFTSIFDIVKTCRLSLDENTRREIARWAEDERAEQPHNEQLLRGYKYSLMVICDWMRWSLRADGGTDTVVEI